MNAKGQPKGLAFFVLCWSVESLLSKAEAQNKKV
jgi:hypothetical protein